MPASSAVPRPAAERGPLRRPALPELPLRGYRFERWTEACFGAGPALMEGGFVGVIADKLFHVHPAVLALVTAAPMFGNLSSSLWARFAHGRRRVPWTALLMAAFTLCVLAVAAIPEGRAGAALLVGLQVVSRQLLGGVTTLRSIVWTLNYPREVRGKLTARLSMISTVSFVATSWAGGQLLDANPQSFRLVYALGALLSAAGVVAFARVPLVGEAEHLAEERLAAEEATSGVLALLRADRLYARFLGWQMVGGISNMMVEAPLLYLVSNEMQASYAESIAATMVVPFALSLVTIPFWALYLDRVHVSAFRAVHGWTFTASQLLLWLGAGMHSLPVVFLARCVQGAARGGGALAWTLGHNDFATRERAGLYMGVHVTLTGVRGAIAPFLGMALYVGWAAHALPGVALELPAWRGLGDEVMPLAAAMSALSALGFRRLQRSISALQP
ncbi:MAG TPA: MFS transporter [Myxococcota bacterium]|nr:MFS transporter [Myxococcota bacterium]